MIVFLDEEKENTNNLYFADWKSRGRAAWTEKKIRQMAQEKGKRITASGILSYSKPLKGSLKNELSGSAIFCMV